MARRTRFHAIRSREHGRPHAAAPSLLVGLLLLASPAIAAPKWTHFATCGDAAQERLYFYDRASVRKSGGQASARLRADYSRVAASRAGRAQLLWTMDCRKRSFVEKSRVEFSKEGRVIARYKPTAGMPINEGSVAEKLLVEVCA